MFYGSSDVLFNDVGSYQKGIFPDPFLDMASLVLPRSLKQILDLCEGVWLKNGTYKMAAQRIVRYFITKVEFEGIAESERSHFTRYLHDTLKVVDQLSLIGDDFLAYGLSLSSIVLPFRRYLVCTLCNSQQPIGKANWSFKEFKFSAYCHKCKKMTPHSHRDRRSDEEDKICVKRWSPQDIRLNCHPISAGTYEFYWVIPADIIREITKGTRFYVEHMPWEIIEAVQKRQMFKFDPGVVYYMREETLAGVQSRGWGMSRLLSNFSQAWYTQVLRRYNEALAQDYIIPFRVLTPGAQQKEGDPLLNTSLKGFVSKVMGMLAEHRRDPATWHALPFPLQYQTMGGEAKNLATPELLTQGMDELLNGVGIPGDLYRGTLQLQAMPTALRLFQQTWPQLKSSFDGWLNWASEIICTALNWDKPERVFLQPVTMADDIELRQTWLQLASANLVSRRTAFAPWSIDAADEQKKIFEEQKLFEELQQTYAEDVANRQSAMQQIQGATPGSQPGMAPAMGQGVPPAQASAAMTPMDLMQQADSLAQQLLQMPYEARRKELMSISRSNTTLHALVKSKLEDYRSEARSVGQQAVLSGAVQ